MEKGAAQLRQAREEGFKMPALPWKPELES
jgi:hypothetical protein